MTKKWSKVAENSPVCLLDGDDKGRRGGGKWKWEGAGFNIV